MILEQNFSISCFNSLGTKLLFGNINSWTCFYYQPRKCKTELRDYTPIKTNRRYFMELTTEKKWYMHAFWKIWQNNCIIFTFVTIAYNVNTIKFQISSLLRHWSQVCNTRSKWIFDSFMHEILNLRQSKNK